MAYYSRIRLLYEVSETSDYANAESVEYISTAQPTRRRVDDVISIPTTGYTYKMNQFGTSIVAGIIKNLEPIGGHFVQIVYYTAIGGVNFQTEKLMPQEMCLLRDLKLLPLGLDIVLTADTAAVLCSITTEGT